MPLHIDAPSPYDGDFDIDAWWLETTPDGRHALVLRLGMQFMILELRIERTWTLTLVDCAVAFVDEELIASSPRLSCAPVPLAVPEGVELEVDGRRGPLTHVTFSADESGPALLLKSEPAEVVVRFTPEDAVPFRLGPATR